MWTRHELKAVQARAFKESEEYLLPARFDGTSVPGLLPTIAYVDLSQLCEEAFADLIFKKIGRPSLEAPIAILGIDPALEASLADAVVYAEEYLQPQSLDLSDTIAGAVRRSFKQAAVNINRRNLLPYLRSESASHRVTGYIAYQVSPQKDMALDFVASLRLEKIEASSRLETRPLWQLLMCVGKLMQLDIDRSDAAVIRTALRESLEWMSRESLVDPGGECKRRICALLEA